MTIYLKKRHARGSAAVFVLVLLMTDVNLSAYSRVYYAQWCDTDEDPGRAKISRVVEIITRLMHTVGEEGMIAYGYKFGPQIPAHKLNRLFTAKMPKKARLQSLVFLRQLTHM